MLGGVLFPQISQARKWIKNTLMLTLDVNAILKQRITIGEEE